MTNPYEEDCNDIIVVHHRNGIDVYPTLNYTIRFSKNTKSLGVYLKSVYKKAEEEDPKGVGSGPVPACVYAAGSYYKTERLVMPRDGEHWPKRLKGAVLYDAVSNGTRTMQPHRRPWYLRGSWKYDYDGSWSSPHYV